MKVISLSFSKDYMDLRLSRPFLSKISALFTGFQSSFPNNAIFPNSQGFQTISWPRHNFGTLPEVSHAWHYMFWACSLCMFRMCMYTNVGASHTCVLRSEDNLSCCFGLLPCLKSHTLSFLFSSTYSRLTGLPASKESPILISSLKL